MKSRHQAQPSHFQTFVQRKALTARQAEIFRLLGKGYDVRRIGEELGIAEGTVKVHQRWLFHKTHTRNRAEAALLSLKLVVQNSP